MKSLLSRIDIRANRPFVTAIGCSVDDLVRRLEGGEPSVKVASGAPLDLLAGLEYAALGDASSEGCSLVQQLPDRPLLGEAMSEPELARIFPKTSQAALLALSSGLLQIHDFWEASHEAAQEADDLGERRFSAYWHAVAHRREPDPSNASYWFRRVGRHPLFPMLAEAAAPLLAEHGDDRLSGRLIGPGGWDPAAMTDLCARARTGTKEETLARRLQRLELGLLLAATAGAAAD